MSFRLQMLQVARVGSSALGDSAELVRAFLLSQLGPAGGGLDRDGAEDLYYTTFVIAGLQALGAELPRARIAGFLDGFEDGEGLDFVHLGALARCWGALGADACPPAVSEAIAERVLAHRSPDGGFSSDAVSPVSSFGTPYASFIATGALQDLGFPIPEPLEIVRSLKRCESPDGAWGNMPGMRFGTTPATAAAVTILHQLEMPVHSVVTDWLRSRANPNGGFDAVDRAPLPDLLSTATALHALSCLGSRLPQKMIDLNLDFLDSLWNSSGGFHGHWADDILDAEYTFYGLLALGHLSL